MNMRDKIAIYLRENTELKNFDAVADGLEQELDETYLIHDRTMALVFKATGMTNVSDLQAVLNRVEEVLEHLQKNMWLPPLGFSREEIQEMLSIVEQEEQTVDGGGEFGPQESTDGWYTRLLRAILKDAPECEECIACGERLEDGDPVYFATDETGHICAACCGPERESYTNPDGTPLRDDQEIPKPFKYQSPETVIAAMNARKLDQPLLPFIDTATLMILEERAKQIEKGWTIEHDDEEHTHREIARAAAAYAQSAAGMPNSARMTYPWEPASLRPKSAEEDLAKAGALAIAALGHIIRAKQRAPKSE